MKLDDWKHSCSIFLATREKQIKTLRVYLAPVGMLPSIPINGCGRGYGKMELLCTVGRSVSDASTLEISLQFSQQN